jgi:DNA-binding NarL/FixJ family response regulator
LVAEGLTNPQIGERMFISRGTVKAHLSHIFAKLNTGTRPNSRRRRRAAQRTRDERHTPLVRHPSHGESLIVVSGHK